MVYHIHHELILNGKKMQEPDHLRHIALLVITALLAIASQTVQILCGADALPASLTETDYMAYALHPQQHSAAGSGVLVVLLLLAFSLGSCLPTSGIPPFMDCLAGPRRYRNRHLPSLVILGSGLAQGSMEGCRNLTLGAMEVSLVLAFAAILPNVWAN